MRLRLALLDLALRLTAKRTLARMTDPARLRATLERDAARLFRAPPGVRFTDDLARRADGSALPLLWADGPGADPARVILYLHGGAFVAGSPRTHRHLAAALAQAAGARAVLPDYALAPEHPFPAALHDTLAAYRHLLDRGVAAPRIALAGDSAGGGLAAAALLAIAGGGLPRPGALVAFSPWADLTGTAAALRRNARADAMLPAHRFADAARFYLGDQDPGDPLASPALATWRDPPPALILASRAEILEDDATTLAQALRQGGGDVELALWHHLPHAWPIFTGWLAESDQAIARAGRFLARHLSP